jgi:hypothetical protein
LGAGHTGGICAIFFNSLFESDEVALGLGHLLPFNVDVTVAVVATGPELLIIPDCSVVEERHGQMVFDQILGGAPQVQRVPVQEGLPERFQFVWCYLSALVLLTQQHVAPKVVS